MEPIQRYKQQEWKVKVKVPQSCPTLWDPMNYTVHGILQARILEWVAVLFSRESSQPSDRTQVSLIAGRFITSWAIREAQEYWSRKPIPFPADLPNPGIKLGSTALQANSLPAELPGKPNTSLWNLNILLCVQAQSCLTLCNLTDCSLKELSMGLQQQEY